MNINFNLMNIKNMNFRIISQPELTFKFVDLKEKDSIQGFANRNIWAKIVKNEIFQKVLNFIGPKYTEDYLLDYEDTIMSVSLFHVANTYYYMNECGYYRSRGECEDTFPLLKYKKCKNKNFHINKELDSIKYLNFLLDISKGGKKEKDLLYKELISLNYYKKLEKLINSNFSYVYSILDRIYESNFESKKRQKRIHKIKDKLLQKEYIIKYKRTIQKQN